MCHIDIYYTCCNITSNNTFIVFRPFQDASQKESNYHISILDCLQALHRAVTLRIFNFTDFDCNEYDRLGKIGLGDITWIVPSKNNYKIRLYRFLCIYVFINIFLDKFIAFPGPTETSREQAPELYITYFKKNNVRTVIRLNRPQYDSQKYVHLKEIYR